MTSEKTNMAMRINISNSNPLEAFSGHRLHSVRRRITPYIICALTGFFASNTVQAVYDLTDAEWKMLPEYCHHQGNVSLNHRGTNGDQWRVILGGDFEAIHHWCVVYVWMMRAYKVGVGSNDGKGLLSRAEGDTGYFLQRMQPDSPRAAEVYTRLGEIYLLQGKYNQAEKALKRAHEIDPKHWQAYFFWANHLFKQGRLADARLEVAAGLEQVPDNKALNALRVELDFGKKNNRK